jgi:DNA primase
MVNKPTQNPKQEIEFNLETATWIPVERSAKSMNYIRDNNIEHAYKSRFCNIQYDVKEDRCVFCIYKNSTIVDAVGRSLTGRKPKWKRYASSKLPFMTKNKSDLCVIVEDCASASAVTIAGHVGVALMGTNLLQEHIPHIVDNFKLAVVALDKDATQKSLDIAKELSVHMQTNIKFLDKDIKTWSKEKILTELS